ncbi:hypothetical protein M3D75_14770 [Microbacterium enclense]|uniref:hypothetical protein n=1 Tax=Microbacterium enclense TaxID=993073 RepID=UPI0021A624DA|nr:hypothetical protein [Microbacterium enclense]MCT2087384.1 hypothetical protein [Microbacterium enclense]
MNVDNATGFASTWYPAAPVRSRAQLINLSSGADITGVVFRLQKMDTIKVVVTVPGSTIGGASTMTVTARMSITQPKPGDEVPLLTTTAAADGSFSFRDRSPAAYVLTYAARAESGLISTNGGPVYVDAGGEVKTVVTMEGSGSVSGHVTLPAGIDDYGAVTAYLHETQQNLVAQTPVREESYEFSAGSFEFGRVAAGEFRVLFDSKDWGELVDKWYDNGAAFSAARTITVYPRATTIPLTYTHQLKRIDVTLAPTAGAPAH